MSDEELAMWINNITTNVLSVLALGSDKQNTQYSSLTINDLLPDSSNFIIK